MIRNLIKVTNPQELGCCIQQLLIQNIGFLSRENTLTQELLYPTTTHPKHRFSLKTKYSNSGVTKSNNYLSKT